jgi:hypothetical protein
MAVPPPVLRHDRLTLFELSRLARDFDQLSAEDGRTWPATAFVEWLRDEWRASADEGNRPVGLDPIRFSA